MSDKWEYANTEDGAIVLLGKDANHQSGKDILYMNEDHTNAKLIAAAPEMFELVKAVAHIGIDFGYGKFELSQEHIAKARELYEANT